MPKIDRTRSTRRTMMMVLEYSEDEVEDEEVVEDEDEDESFMFSSIM